MPKAKPMVSLSGMIDSDMEEASDVDMMPTPESNQENKEPTKTAGRKAKAAPRPRKTKAASRRLSGGTKPKAATKKKGPAQRAQLKEQANEQQFSGTEEVEDFQEEISQTIEYDEMVVQQEKEISIDELDAAQAKKPPGKKGRPSAKSKAVAKKAPAEQLVIADRDGDFEYTPTSTRQGKAVNKGAMAMEKPGGRRGRAATGSAQPEMVIPETQDVAMELDQLVEPDEEDDDIPQSVYRKVHNARSTSRQPQPSFARRRAGSASDTDKAGTEPAIRRKLGDMTKKLENLELKYRSLREVGVKEAEANFDKLKKQSEERNKAANDLIASLRKELTSQKSLTFETRTLRSNLETTTASLSACQEDLKHSKASLTSLSNENKALQVKLAAARSSSATVESASNYARTPGSAIKGKTSASRTIMVGSAEAAMAAQIAQLKLDLYSDLTGLILRGVDRQDDQDVYDCIQTGRNGALHYHLAITHDSDKSTAYEDIEFRYTPRLDSNRDAELLEILPDYLMEEITFGRLQAGKFFTRVVDTLTRGGVVREE